MTKRFRGIYLFVASILITFLNIPFGFAKPATKNSTFAITPRDTVSLTINKNISFRSELKSVYDSLNLNLKGLSLAAFNYAEKGFKTLIQKGTITNDSIISIVDFSLQSGKKRLFIIDIKNFKVLFNTFVAHGKNTGREIANSFSNQNQSYKSSPGFYITGETYQGKNGYSLKLIGIEKGINDNAYERGIVIHGADYVSDAFVNMQGYIGRSQGCPAIPLNVNRPIINTIKNGSCLFIYHPTYTVNSSILN